GPRRAWFVPTGAACGLAVLAKGPVGVLLPALVIGLYLLWQRQLRRLFDCRLLLGVLAFLLVAAPWYALIGVETRGEFLRRFWFKHNLNRFLQPMEQHAGPVWFHAAALFVGFAPWSVFLVPSLVSAVQSSKFKVQSSKLTGPYRFLLCWFATYLVFFSAAATKLPNYVLPLYPAVALLTAHFLERWRSGELEVPAWLMPTCLGGLLFVGAVTGFGVAVA